MTASSNVDLVRSIFANLERGDFLTSAEWAHPEIEFVVTDGPEPGRWTGRAGMADNLRDWLSAWEGYRIAADEYRALDDERVLVLYHRSGHGKTSGLDLSQFRPEGAALVHVRDGKVTRLVIYFDHISALVDLGLAPEAHSPAS